MNVQGGVVTPNSNIPGSATNFINPPGGITAGSGVEGRMQIKMASGGTVSLLGTYIISNNRADSTLRTRINGADGNSVITINGTGQFEDASNTDTLVDDDLVCLTLITGAGGTTFTFSVVWWTFAPSSGTRDIIVGDIVTNASGTADGYYPFTGQTISLVTTEANAQNRMAVAATLQNGSFFVQSNGRSDNSSMKTRINAASGNMNVVINAATSGQLEDVSNTDSVADGDEVNWLWDQNGGSGTLTMRAYKIEIAATDAYMMFGSHIGEAQIGTVTFYRTPWGMARYTTEADAQLKSNVAFTWSDLSAYLQTFSLNSGNYTMRSRINGAQGNMVLTFSGTGQQTDTSNTDSIADDDEFNLQTVTTAASGSAGLTTASSLATTQAGGTSVKDFIQQGIIAFAR